MKRILVIIMLLFVFQIYFFGQEQVGIASWYGPKFHGKQTANGEIFNTYDFTAAHKTLPLGSIVKVISLENDQSTIVRINDRGPFVKNRIIDLSMAAAEQLGMIKKGTMKVKTILLEKGDNIYHKYTPQKYAIQLASFINKDKAEAFLKSIQSKTIKKAKIKRVKLQKIYYRIVLDDINYSELQLYRVKLHQEGLSNYLVMKK